LVAVVCFLILCFEIGQKASVSFIFLQIIAVNLFWSFADCYNVEPPS
jgi:hypothetical protein